MKTILTIIVLLVTTIGFSQTVISGKILNQKDIPVSLANIYISGSYDGATATENGEFSFTTTLSGNQTLVITALGFEDFSKAIVIEEFQNQTIVLEKKANQLEEVAITAGSMHSGDKARVSVLKPLDILTTAGNPGDIVSALKTLPGTQIVGESGKLFVRGGTADETQTYIDGIRVAQPYVQTANNVPTRSTFSPLLFKGTTFTTGGYSAEFGEALSSVLLMNTIDDPDFAKTDVSVMCPCSWRSTTICVAIPAWSVPNTHSILSPDIQW